MSDQNKKSTDPVVADVDTKKTGLSSSSANVTNGTTATSHPTTSSESNKSSLETDLENLDLTLDSTESTTDDESLQAVQIKLFTPISKSEKPNMFRTPDNQQIEISFEKLGLSPTMMKYNEDKVLQAMHDDGCWEHYLTEAVGTHRFGSNENNTVRLVVFLYGTGFYDDETRQDRVSKIKEIIFTKASRDRLRQIVFSETFRADYYFPSPLPDGMTEDDIVFDRLNRFAASLRILQKGDVLPFVGPGFTGQPFYCVQSSSNCYLPASTNYVTLLHRNKVDKNGRKIDPDHKPLDIGKVARKHEINEKKGFEKRVLENRGGKACSLTSKILNHTDPWSITLSFASLKRPGQDSKELKDEKIERENSLVSELQRGRHGLVSRWRTSEGFKAASEKLEKNISTEPGILEFTKPWTYDTGSFRQFDRDDCFEEKMEELRAIYDEQKNEINEKRDRYKTATQEIIDNAKKFSCKSDVTISDSMRETTGLAKNGTEAAGSTTGLHAMILLGCYEKKCKDGCNKNMFVLWNWWEAMPLVAVTFEHLVEAESVIQFSALNLAAIENDDLDCSTNSLILDCHYPDNGEDPFFYNDDEDGDY